MHSPALAAGPDAPAAVRRQAADPAHRVRDRRLHALRRHLPQRRPHRLRRPDPAQGPGPVPGDRAQPRLHRAVVSTSPARGWPASRTRWPAPGSSSCTPTTAATRRPTRCRRRTARPGSATPATPSTPSRRWSRCGTSTPSGSAMLGRSMGGGVTMNALVDPARAGRRGGHLRLGELAVPREPRALHPARPPGGGRRRSSTSSGRRRRRRGSTASCRRAPTSTGSPSRCWSTTAPPTAPARPPGRGPRSG